MYKKIPKVDNLNNCKEIYKKISSAYGFDFSGSYHYKNEAKRVYYYTCVKLNGYSISVAAKAINKDHTNAIYHLKMITKKDEDKSKYILEGKKFFIIPEEHKLQNVYEKTGFRYK